MKFLIIGGTGLIGTKVAQELWDAGHTVVVASSSNGINAITGEGLEHAFNQIDVVIDLINSATFEEEAVVNFFRTASRNLVQAGAKAGVKHYVVLSIVGTDIMQNIGYMKAKKVQEDTIKNSGIPYTIVRSTQFHEFVPTLTNIATQRKEINISTLDFQPIAAENVASLITRFALEIPLNETFDIAGPERKGMDQFVEDFVHTRKEQLTIVPNDNRMYVTAAIPQSALVPEGEVYTGDISFKVWLQNNSIVS